MGIPIFTPKQLVLLQPQAQSQDGKTINPIVTTHKHIQQQNTKCSLGRVRCTQSYTTFVRGREVVSDKIAWPGAKITQVVEPCYGRPYCMVQRTLYPLE